MLIKHFISIPKNNFQYPFRSIYKFMPSLPILNLFGNPALLQVPLTAIFCSRKCSGDTILDAYDFAHAFRESETPVISGFHTPVEKHMLEILLKGNSPIIICPARSLEGMRVSEMLRGYLSSGRLLFCSVADPKFKRPTAETAEQRNRLVAALATNWIFIHIEPGGKLEKLNQQIQELR